MSRRLLPALFVVALLAFGCGTEPGDRTTLPPQPASPEAASTSQPITLRELTLRADLSERPARWRLVASIPFGGAETELGFSHDHEGVPRSFAVASEGSFWIVDDVKERIARFSRNGAFIEAVGGFGGASSARPRDIAIIRDHVYVIEEEDGAATLTTIAKDGRRVREALRDRTHPVAVSLLFPSADRLIAHVGGYADPPGSGPTGYGELPLRGALRLLPGVPVGDETWVDIRARGDQDLQYTSTRGTMHAVQPIHVSVVGGAPPKKLPALVGPAIETTFQTAVGIYVRVAPARPSDAERYGGGAWYLRLGADREPLVWERLPEARVADEEQVRHLAAGPDGRVYLMVPDREGEKIYVRPER